MVSFIPAFILIIIVFGLIIDFHKTFVFMIVSFLWLMNFNLELPGGLTFYATLSLIAFTIFLAKYRRCFNKGIYSFPFYLPFLLLIFSSTATNFIIGPSHLPSLIISFFSSYINVIIIWCLFKERPNRISKLFVWTSLLYGGVIAAYNIIEVVIQDNPLIDSLLKSGIYMERAGTLVEDYRFGLRRTQSIFLMHTTNGCACTLLFCTLAYAYRETKLLRKSSVLIILLLLASVFLTGSRACILGLVICSFGLFRIKKIKISSIFISLIALVLTTFIFQDYLQTVCESFIDTDSVHGSSSDMRDAQFAIAAYFMYKSPVWGNGNNFTWNTARYEADDLFGAESMWFPVMIDNGIVGVIAIAFMWAVALYYCYRHSKRYGWVVLGMLAMNSFSSLPNFQPTYILIYLIYLTHMSSKVVEVKKTKKHAIVNHYSSL